MTFTVAGAARSHIGGTAYDFRRHDTWPHRGQHRDGSGDRPGTVDPSGVSMTYGAVLEEWLAASSKAGAQLDTYLEDRKRW